jgi:hypothetical protein
MPDLVLPAEADHCIHCGGVLYNPPICCEEAKAEYRQFLDDLYSDVDPDDYDYRDEGVID